MSYRREKFPKATPRGIGGSGTRYPPHAFNDYRDLYTLSMQARYRDGFRTHDSHRRHALLLLGRLEKGLPFPQGPPPGAA